LLLQAISVEGLKNSMQTDYILKVLCFQGCFSNLLTNYLHAAYKIIYESIFQILGLDICADTRAGDATRPGISGGQKRRLTTGTFTFLQLLIVF